MEIKWLLAFLILIVFISGCVLDGGDDQIEPTYNDNALKMEIKIREKEEKRRILPDQTIRMVVTLTNQVENATEDVNLEIINPYGIEISKVDCGNDCMCVWNESSPQGYTKSGCGSDIDCAYNGCQYDSIQSLDEVEIIYGLKIPSEEEISSMGRELKPKIGLEYEYKGISALYVPIYRYGEKPAEPKKEFTQTTGPIHVEIDSENWVRAGDLFPIYVDVKDVGRSSEKVTIYKNDFTMCKDHADIGSSIGRCDFVLSGNCYISEKNITPPLINPLVCTLRAEQDPATPMVKAPIIIDYSYRYELEKIETIRVEKAFLGIF